MGAQIALAVPDQLLGRQPARALHITAFDLPDVQRRVQRCACVMQDIGAQNAVFTGQSVHGDLGDRSAIGEVEERTAAALDPVPFDLGCFVEPGRRQADAALIGQRGGFGEAIAFFANRNRGRPRM